VRDDGWKRNRRHVPKTKGEDPPLDVPGAYFFLFSIYQRPSSDKVEDDDSEIVPLLRFSTPSLAEKTLWIQLISETCAYTETDAFLQHEASSAAELVLRRQEQIRMTMAMPEAKEGTLPPLYFAPAKQKLEHARRPSFNKLPEKYLIKSKDEDVDKADANSTQGYPPSKPMHRAAAPSYLSVEAPAQNYRGFFNLLVIILGISNFRLILAAIHKHGFVFSGVLQHARDLSHISRDPWEEFPFVSGFLLQLVFITVTFAIEWLLSRKKLSESVGMILHQINAHSAIAVSTAIVWNFINKPATGVMLLSHATITWMKLISYYHANEDYRLSANKAGGDYHTATLALVEDLDEVDEHISYPRNVTLRNMIYFCAAPTLTYQIAFPKYPRIRIFRVFGILFRMVGILALFTFLAAQIVSPVLQGLVKDLEATNGVYTAGILADYWLRLSIANIYLWLLGFYFYFHLYLNLCAEVLRFGDRVYYKDWWNSSDVGSYWRLWNVPVHYWLIRHGTFHGKFNPSPNSSSITAIDSLRV
jgi:diacylglycerol O-acyltransferase-1